MSKLAQQLLAYARGGKYQEKMVSGSELIRDFLPQIKHVVNSNINIDTNIPDNVFFIKADMAQMHMVLSAVITNASEAMEGKGRINVTCRNEVISEKRAVDFPDLKAGNYVFIKIEDDGRGMDEEIRNRVFEPFFTTKFTGRGLGMAAAYGIIKNHSGSISIDSKSGSGTTVTIYIPALKTQAKVHALPKVEPLISKGTGTIFVIEDEQMVMDLLILQLEKLGYRVLSAMTGNEAVKIAESFDGDIDLAILDMILPDMRGIDIYKSIKKARPDMKVIVSSGYSIDGPAKEVLEAGAEAFLQKPFRKAELSEILKKTLGAG